MARESFNVHGALADRFADPEWALFFEVSNGTGGNRTRSADAVALNLWPSRGMELHGVEVKISRGDWQRELKDPAKSSAIMQYCDRWWLAVNDEGIVFPGELPPTWGLLVPKGKKLVAKVEAPKLEAKPLDRTFVAAVLRRSNDQRAAEAAARIEAKADARLAEAEKSVEHWKKKNEETAAWWREQLASANARWEEFSKASGVYQQSNHSLAQIGVAVHAVLTGAADREVDRMRKVAEQSAYAAQSLADLAKRAQAELDAMRATQAAGGHS